MKRIVSVFERKPDGKVAIVMDRREIECDDDHRGIAEVANERRSKGATMVLILAADDSTLHHWTKPEDKPSV